MFKDKLHDKNSMIIHGHLLFSLNFVFLEIFQKPRGGRRTTARRLLLSMCISGFLKRNCLAALYWPPGDACGITQFLGFVWMA